MTFDSTNIDQFLKRELTKLGFEFTPIVPLNFRLEVDSDGEWGDDDDDDHDEGYLM